MARSGGMMKFPDPAILVTIFFKKYEIPTYLRFLG